MIPFRYSFSRLAPIVFITISQYLFTSGMAGCLKNKILIKVINSRLLLTGLRLYKYRAFYGVCSPRVCFYLFFPLNMHQKWDAYYLPSESLPQKQKRNEIGMIMAFHQLLQ